MKNFESERPEKHIPAAKKLVYLDRQMFATIVSMIPAGKLTTREAIYEMWAKRKGVDHCELQNYSILPIDKRVLWKPTDVQRVDFIDDLKSMAAMIGKASFAIGSLELIPKLLVCRLRRQILRQTKAI